MSVSTQRPEELKDVLKRLYVEVFPARYISPEQCEAIWVLSTGRCGTLTLSNLLNLSEKIASFHEPMPRLWELNNMAYRDPHNDVVSAVVKHSKFDLITSINSLGFTYAECSHRNTMYSYVLRKAFPRSKFIYLMRDMDGTVQSGYNWGWYGTNDKYINGRILPTEVMKDRGILLAWYWITVNEFIQKFLATIPRNDWFYLDYESIKTRDYDAMNKMFNFFNLDPPEQKRIEGVLMADLNKGKRVPIEKTWGDYDSRSDRIYNSFRAA